ncbi:MAG: nucleotide sugar dehydrogenase [Syntrophomonadaceae bacterium]|nr:nucleotide sugar dehydrogenase [Syntrophomonadaceae bacterium]
MNCKEILKYKLEKKTAVAGVVGLGYVGLPFAVEKAKVGFKVIAIEQNPVKAEKINRGQNYIADVSDDELKDVVRRGLLTSVSGFDRVPEMDVIVICVPTPLSINLTPDLQYVESVTRSIMPKLRPGQLITLESTTYPGTTEEIILPILKQSGLEIERDFFLAHSPERVDPGNLRYSTKNTNKLLGAVGPASLEVAIAFYQQTIENLVPLSCPRAAELAKVFENTFRAVNIALVNEMTLLCDRMGLNVWEILDAAFTKPFGIMPFYPGPGVGGHCIPIDPHYLEWKAREYNFHTHFIALAGEINRKMPEYVKDKAIRILNHSGIAASQARIMVLGVAYKKDVEDKRESPAIEIIRLLKKEGSDLIYHDPHVNRLANCEIDMNCSPLNALTLSSCDLVIIATDHSNIDYQWLVDNSLRIFDTRNAACNVARGRNKITLL